MPDSAKMEPPVLAANSSVASAAGGDGVAIARASGVALVTIAGCATWFFSLYRLGVSVEAIPWYLTVSLIGVISAQSAARGVLKTQLTWPPLSRQREPLSLLETWSLTYLFVSLLLCLWTFLQPTTPATQTRRLVQFVDIQLTSTADFANRQSPLPGTQEQPELHKRQSDKVTRQGQIDVPKLPAASQPSQQKKADSTGRANTKQKPAPQTAQQAQQTPLRQIVPPLKTAVGRTASMEQMSGDDMILIKPATASAPAAPRNKATGKAKADANRPLFEEVQPPELVEMIENDGSAQSTDVFQAGGSTTGGTGAANALSEYMKALHKRIKNLWSPPRGQSHRAAILFRVKPNGQLSFVKLVESSGDPATDEAAVKAVVGSVSGHPLPTSFQAPYLDVQYTFNYTVDELQEVKARITIH